jgi:hypothetical protein
VVEDQKEERNRQAGEQQPQQGTAHVIILPATLPRRRPRRHGTPGENRGHHRVRIGEGKCSLRLVREVETGFPDGPAALPQIGANSHSTSRNDKASALRAEQGLARAVCRGCRRRGG